MVKWRVQKDHLARLIMPKENSWESYRFSQENLQKFGKITKWYVVYVGSTSEVPGVLNGRARSTAPGFKSNGLW